MANLFAQLAFVLGGLRLTSAPAEAYRALTLAPMLVAQKAGLYTKLVAGRGASAWVRTARPPVLTLPRALPAAARPTPVSIPLAEPRP